MSCLHYMSIKALRRIQDLHTFSSNTVNLSNPDFALLWDFIEGAEGTWITENGAHLRGKKRLWVEEKTLWYQFQWLNFVFLRDVSIGENFDVKTEDWNCLVY